MHTEPPLSTSTSMPRPAHAEHLVPWTAHLLAAALYTLGTCGLLGALPASLNGLGLGLGLLITIGALIVAARTQIRHHGRLFSAVAVGSPRSLLSGWVASGPLFFHLLLPDTASLGVAVMLSLLLGTVFFAVLRLEDSEVAERSSTEPEA